jgi:hypothetical protein
VVVGFGGIGGVPGGEAIEVSRQAFLVGPPTVVINENFSAPSSTFTPVTGGVWQVADGSYELRSPASAVPNGDLAVAAPVIRSDFNVQVVARALAGPGWNDFSIVFAYHAPSDYYFASLPMTPAWRRRPLTLASATGRSASAAGTTPVISAASLSPRRRPARSPTLSPSPRRRPGRACAGSRC